MIVESSTEIERAAAAWLARRDAPGWSERDEAELAAWLESTAHRVAWLRLQAAWEQSDRLRALAAGMPPDHVPARGSWNHSRFSRRAGHNVALEDANSGEHPTGAGRAADMLRGRLLRWLAAAAVLLLVAGALGFQSWRMRALEEATYATAVGELRTVSLADGSRATLSSGSELGVTLARNERHIALRRGEAFFDVAKDADRPFVVQSGKRSVVAVGTHFAVRADGEALRVIVVEGSVRLTSATPEATMPALLSAGMIAVADAGGVHTRTYPVDRAEEMLSWRTGLLSFRATPLAEAASEFNRYNTRKLVIDDPAIGAMPISGNFRWSNTDAFVRLVEQGFALHAERRGDDIVLRGARPQH